MVMKKRWKTLILIPSIFIVTILLIILAAAITGRLFPGQFSLTALPTLIFLLFLSLIILPFGIYFIWKTRINQPITAFKVTEMTLQEEEVALAVNQWIYNHLNKRSQGAVEFSMSEDEGLICRCHIIDEN